ncbi:MAG: amylo-alpha-1,6-glucosidase [Sandaracinaceae bacterium]|nr:amylo-alpha-1,6-glucosidase [Sandaracinaceae bacterium]
MRESEPPLLQLDAPPSARDIRDATLIKERDVFLLTDLEGNAPLGNTNGFGLYLRDTRFLSGYELAIAGLRPTILLSSTRSQFMSAQVLTNPNLVLPDGQRVAEQTLQVRRYRVVRGQEIAESLTFQNFNSFAVELEIALHLAADFADIFEVRGIVRVDERGVMHPPRYEGAVLEFRYAGRDQRMRSTTIRFEPEPTRCTTSGPTAVPTATASYRIRLEPGGSQRLSSTVRLAEISVDADAPEPPRPAPTLAGYKQPLADEAAVVTDNELFNAILAQSRLDLRLLLGGSIEEPFVCAGIPWYATLFGRDCLITALLDLWRSPSLAKSTLRLLAKLQGKADDPERDEEPGKILHEMRRGELARLGAIPFGPYYGTIDATLLWILLLAAHYRATADLALVRELGPNLERALAWIDAAGDLDGDGFVEYRCRSPNGLVNQGWKDSWDGIVHADGRLAEPPIALVEVQAYLYAALRGAAMLLDALSQFDRARTLRTRSQHLRARFDTAFWMPDDEFYAVALDRGKQQVRTVTSNPGHALLMGIVPDERRSTVAHRLMEEDLHSGFGVRTLSMRERAYNPAGYHLGTIWPHDNALLALGLKRAGEEALLHALFAGQYDAAQHFPGLRLPELYCGFARTAFGVPVRYPVACTPQAWAAASWSGFLQASLGLLPAAPMRELRIARPDLPPFLRWVEVKHLQVGDAQIDLRYQRVGDHTAVDVSAMRGDVRVALVSGWDPD